jgi:hypothetical protein
MAKLLAILVCLALPLMVLKGALQAVGWWLGQRADRVHRRAIEELWYYLEEHSLGDGVRTLLGRVIQKVKDGGWKPWVWLLGVAFFVNLVGGFFAPFFGGLEAVTFKGFLDYCRRFFSGNMDVIPLKALADPSTAPSFWQVFFWPMVIFATLASGISLLVSWWAVIRVVRNRTAAQVWLTLGVSLCGLLVMFLATELFYVRVRVRLGPGGTLTWKQWYELFVDFINFDRLVATGGSIPQLIWWIGESLPLLLCCTLLATYLGIWKAPASVRTKVQHVADRLVEGYGKEKSILGQTSSFIGWILSFVLAALFIIRMLRVM